MTNKIEITKYDPTRAKWYFALFKFLELFGVFLFTFGFYGLGSLVCNHFPNFFTNFGEPACDGSYFMTWSVGLMTFCLMFIGLAFALGILYVVYSIIKAWMKGNWNLAKRCSEDKTAKAKRLKEEELEQKKADRKRWGYCVGDEAKYICNEDKTGNWERFGQKCKILKIDKDGDIYPEWEDGTIGGVDGKHVFISSFKVTKKQSLK